MSAPVSCAVCALCTKWINEELCARLQHLIVLRVTRILFAWIPYSIAANGPTVHLLITQTA